MLARRHWRVTSVRLLRNDWLTAQTAPVPNYSQKDRTHKCRTKGLQLKYLDEKATEAKQFSAETRLDCRLT